MADAEGPASLSEQFEKICKKYSLSDTYRVLCLTQYFDLRELYPLIDLADFTERWCQRKQARFKRRPDKAVKHFSGKDQCGWNASEKCAWLLAYLEYLELFDLGLNEQMADALGDMALQRVNLYEFLEEVAAPGKPGEGVELDEDDIPTVQFPLEDVGDSDIPTEPAPFETEESDPQQRILPFGSDAGSEAPINVGNRVAVVDYFQEGFDTALRGYMEDVDEDRRTGTLLTDQGERIYDISLNRLRVEEGEGPPEYLLEENAVKFVTLEVPNEQANTWHDFLEQEEAAAGTNAGEILDSVGAPFGDGTSALVTLRTGPDNQVLIHAELFQDEGLIQSLPPRDVLFGIYPFGNKLLDIRRENTNA